MKKLFSLILVLGLMQGGNGYAVTTWLCFKDNQPIKFFFDDTHVYIHFNYLNKTTNRHKITRKTDSFLNVQWKTELFKDDLKIDLRNKNVSWWTGSDSLKVGTLKIYNQCKVL